MRDPQAQEKAKQKMAGGDAFYSSSNALVPTDSSSSSNSNGGAASSPPGAVLSLQKAYPLMAAKLQLGEFAGYVKEEATGEQDDCYVLLDASRQVLLLLSDFFSSVPFLRVLAIFISITIFFRFFHFFF